MRRKIPQKTPWYPVRPAGMTNACYNPGTTAARMEGHGVIIGFQQTCGRNLTHAHLCPIFHPVFRLSSTCFSGLPRVPQPNKKNCTRKMVQQISRTWQPFLHLFHTGKVLRAFNPCRHSTFSAKRKPIFLNPPLALGKTGDSPRAAWEDGGAARDQR